MEYLIAGFAHILNPVSLMWITLGVSLGYFLGAMPGLGKATGVAVAIPMTFYLDPVSAIAMLIGIAKGSAAGSAVSAILLNTPGEPSSAPTALDGYPLARQGKGQKALKIGLYSSVFGDIAATTVLIVLAAPLAAYALLIGPVEICAILLFSLTFIGGLSGDSLTKGMISGALGIFVATVGIETETFIPRMTFGFLQLDSGISLVPMAIGMLAVAEMMVQAGTIRQLDREALSLASNSKNHDSKVTRSDWRRIFPAIIRGSIIGSIVGILPGLGASVGSFLSYGAARRASKSPEKFGAGMIEGVAAAESADNAVVPASLVPLFALGIPGSVIAAILISALVLHGMTPGPLMFEQQPQKVGDLYAALICASLIMLIVGSAGQYLFVQALRVPMRLIIPIVLFFCCLGSYMESSSVFSIYLMLIFAVVGFLMKKLGYSFVTFLIGFVIAPNFELTLRQSIQILDQNPFNLFYHPLAVAFLIATALTIFMIGRANLRSVATDRQIAGPELSENTTVNN